MTQFRLVVSGGIAVMLLVLYVFLVIHALDKAINCDVKLIDKCEMINARVLTGLNTLQGLVSALVIAVLAVSEPGKPLAAHFNVPGLLGKESQKAIAVITVVSAAYVVVWVLAGAAVYVYGYLLLPDELTEKYKTVVDLGASWFGLAIAAVFSYFGIKRAS